MVRATSIYLPRALTVDTLDFRSAQPSALLDGTTSELNRGVGKSNEGLLQIPTHATILERARLRDLLREGSEAPENELRSAREAMASPREGRTYRRHEKI